MKLLLILLLFPALLHAQPKLVVGIVVDQMRYDYLHTFKAGFCDSGFVKLMTDGYQCHQVKFNYVPTYTGPGHASIYTGTTPALHGITGNSWYDRNEQKTVNCIGDEPKGPHRLLVTTVTDELKQRYGNKSKVYGIALKDRSAILPAGHQPDGAFWLDNQGNWTSSAYYMTQPPLWLQQLNRQKHWKRYLAENWNLLLAESLYISRTADDNPYEERLPGETSTAFPHLTAHTTAGDAAMYLAHTPHGNTITTDLALQLIREESMGTDSIPDFLCISYSSPDYIGHAWGPQSREVEDCFYRLDRDIARLLTTLDSTIGKENYLLFLTTDHGVAENPALLKTTGISTGNYTTGSLKHKLDSSLSLLAGKGKWVEKIMNGNIYFNPDLNQIIPASGWMSAARQIVMNEPYVQAVYDRHQLASGCQDPLCSKAAAGFNPAISGDLVFLSKPGWVNTPATTGSSHGSPYSYDTRAPLIWYGYRITKGNDYQEHDITDIAPTLSQLLGIPWPNGTTGKMIPGLFSELFPESVALPVDSVIPEGNNQIRFVE